MPGKLSHGIVVRAASQKGTRDYILQNCLPEKLAAAGFSGSPRVEALPED